MSEISMITTTTSNTNVIAGLTALSEYVTIGKDIIVGLSAAAAAFCAYLGLSAWRRELRGKSRYVLAKELLLSVYKVREGFKRVRRASIFQYEYPQDMVDYHGHLLPEKEYEGMEHVYQTRWNLLDEAFRDLEEKHLDAQVEWGPELENTITPLRECRAELLSSISFTLRNIKERSAVSLLTGSQKDEYDKVMNEMSALLHSKVHGETFTEKINQAIMTFEAKFRPYINS
jgi:hypothetical protein